MAAAEQTLVSARDLNANTKNYRNVYYDSGFAIEQGLKAIWLKQEGLTKIPPECMSAKWHNLENIINRIDLKSALIAKIGEDHIFGANWMTVKDWDSNKRFPGTSISKKDAQEMLIAVAHDKHGVMRWVRNRYEMI